MNDIVSTLNRGQRGRSASAAGEARSVLRVEGLRVGFRGQGRAVEAVRGLDLELGPGKVLGLVGESGSGKTASCFAILGLLPQSASRRGRIFLDGEELSDYDERRYVQVRGKKASIVFQEPRKYFDPSMRIGSQIEEILMNDIRLPRREARELCLEALASVGLEGARVAASFPHELSGGMCQRASIAMAVARGPSLLIADEPTTALDASVQRSVLDILVAKVEACSMSMIFVSHDLRAVNYVADEVAVMLDGLVVEQGPCAEIVSSPLHPYTRLLIDSIPGPDFKSRGRPRAEGISRGSGCSFAGRCPLEEAECSRSLPLLAPVASTNGRRCLRCPIVGGRS